MVPLNATLESVKYAHCELNVYCIKAIWPNYPWIMQIILPTVSASVEQLPVTCAAQPSVIKTTCSELDLETWRFLNTRFNWVYSHILLVTM